MKTLDHPAARLCFKLTLTGALMKSLGILCLLAFDFRSWHVDTGRIYGQLVGSTILAQLPSVEQVVGWGGAVGR